MTNKQSFRPENLAEFKHKALKWATSFDTFCYLESNEYADPFTQLDALIAVGVNEEIVPNTLEQLDAFTASSSDICPGFLSYDLKNKIEALDSTHPDGLAFPEAYFFKPLHCIELKNGAIEIRSEDPQGILQRINAQKIEEKKIYFNGKLSARFSQKEYVETVQKLKEHIQQGDIYEVNLCQELYAEQAQIEPLELFLALNRISPTPFATFFKYKQHYILSASPERYLSKQGTVLRSQPIKGTAKRSTKPQEDAITKQALANSPKEQAENVMIVDLVRNDLSRCANRGSVQVDELFGVYSFKQVHQLISTVSCTVGAEITFSDMIKATFPMGSMTGAPKIRAMQLIEQYERTKRGIYSGSVGYIRPNGDFDFNVIIRSLLYNAENKYLSFQVGGAITAQSIAEKEYEECMLKAEAMLQVLGQ